LESKRRTEPLNLSTRFNQEEFRKKLPLCELFKKKIIKKYFNIFNIPYGILLLMSAHQSKVYLSVFHKLYFYNNMKRSSVGNKRMRQSWNWWLWWQVNLNKGDVRLIMNFNIYQRFELVVQFVSRVYAYNG
jgi:hypothetical protein